MENLYQKQTYDSVIDRLNKLTPSSQRLWGKMEVAQMLAHCKEAFKVPLSKTNETQPHVLSFWMDGKIEIV